MNRRCMLAALAGGCLSWVASAVESVPALTPFSSVPPGTDTFAGWVATYLSSVKKHTRFTAVDHDGVRALRIEANASLGSLIHTLRGEPATRTTLRWRWNLPRHNPKTDMRTNRGDDYPVRLYVMFDYDIGKLGMMDRTKLRIARAMYGDNVPAAALCYVWDPTLPAGYMACNAFTQRVRMIVVRSGSTELGLWVNEERNIRRDFKAAFGEEAPNIAAIAVAGDGDNTGESTVAYVGDLQLDS